MNKLKWLGTIITVISAYGVSMLMPWSKYCYISYFVAGSILLYVSIKQKDIPYVFLNCAFILSDTIGIIRWIL